MARRLAEDETGAVTADWITLSAGIILLGLMVVFSVMNNSAGYLMDEFDDLNNRFAKDGQTLALGTAPGDDPGIDQEEAAAEAAAANASSALSAASSDGAGMSGGSAASKSTETSSPAAAIEARPLTVAPSAARAPAIQIPSGD